MKCEICKSEVKTLFLEKILGTYLKDGKGKQHVICFECQTKFKSKAEQLKQINK